MVVCYQMEALCDSVIFEEPPKLASVICVAIYFTDVSDRIWVGVDDVVLPEGAVGNCHVLARILSQRQLEEDGQKPPASSHFLTLGSTESSTSSILRVIYEGSSL